LQDCRFAPASSRLLACKQQRKKQALFRVSAKKPGTFFSPGTTPEFQFHE
jgi:hypothetical protein